MLVKPLERPIAAQPEVIRRSILIVDDDEALADVLSTRLTRQGFDTTVADNGALGFTLARTNKPDVIVLDLRLPDIDGFELCEQLVDDEATADIPVIVVSGLERPDVLRRCRAAGCLYYVRKPYDPNALLTLIEQAIEESDR
jgi:CheY-like chemotaxis protein